MFHLEHLSLLTVEMIAIAPTPLLLTKSQLSEKRILNKVYIYIFTTLSVYIARDLHSKQITD